MLIKLLEMVKVLCAALNEISHGSFSCIVLRLYFRIHDSCKSNIKVIVFRLMHLAFTSIIGVHIKSCTLIISCALGNDLVMRSHGVSRFLQQLAFSHICRRNFILVHHSGLAINPTSRSLVEKI